MRNGHHFSTHRHARETVVSPTLFDPTGPAFPTAAMGGPGRVRILLRSLLAGVLVATLAGVAGARPAAATGPCRAPVYTTSDPWGRWSSYRYTVDNDMWNAAGHRMRQRLTVCDQSSWYAVARLPLRTDRSVKSYPNAHLDFHDWTAHTEPRLSAYRSLPVRWASRLPRAGRYDVAWDVWLDGVPGDDAGRVRTEVMIWTANQGSVPSGRRVASTRFAGRRWQVWRDRSLGHPYYALVPGDRIARGSFDLMRPLTWMRHRGWLRPRVTLGQVAFGFEVVATRGRPLRFATTGFSVRGVRR